MAARPPPPPPQKPLTDNSAPNAGAPNQSLYIKNLNDKIHKSELKRALYMIFSTYGPVLDIVTVRAGSKGQQMRGQAHIVYRDIQTSTQAMRALQGFEFFGKELKISYAKGTSHIIPKLRGTFEASTTVAPGTETTELQKSIFNAPPSSMTMKPVSNGLKAPEEPAPHGVKRPREEQEDEEEEEEEVPMEEDEDDAPMDEDDDD